MSDVWKHYETIPETKHIGQPFESRAHPDSRYRARSPRRAQYIPAIPQVPRRRYHKGMKVSSTKPTHNHSVSK